MQLRTTHITNIETGMKNLIVVSTAGKVYSGQQQVSKGCKIENKPEGGADDAEKGQMG